MKKLAALLLLLFLTTGMAFADTPNDSDAQPAKAPAPAKPKAAKKAEKTDSAIAAEIEELRQAIQSQQEQLQLLKEELAKRDRQIDEAREAAAAANASAAEASSKAVEAVNSSAEVKTTAATLNTTVSDLKASNEALKTTVATEAAQARSEENPVAIRYKGINFSPGGFIAAESVWRQRGVSGDVNTPFTGIPFGSAGTSKTSEFNATGRQSRLTFLADGKLDNVTLMGYYELDWLGACSSSNNRQSNSYCMRQRQIWGALSNSSGWYVSGGQMWSLLTEYKKGLKNRDEAIPMTIDPQYSVGFTWARQYGFRVVKSFNDKFALGFSVEGPQTTFGGRGAQANSFFINAPGNAGGLFNPVDTTGYTLNAAPDFIVKAAADPGWGHYELFGVFSTFRARIYPCSVASVATPCPVDSTITAPSASHAFNDSRSGGGVGANIRVPLFQKKLDAGVHVFGGGGVGRYTSAGLADVTARPDGTLTPIRGGSALASLEFHPNSMLDVYFEGGGEYAFRAAYISAANRAVGYGSPFFNNSGCDAEGLPGSFNSPATTSGTTCNGDLRNVLEGTIGFWHKLYNGPRGGLRWGIQYSYLVKNTWSGNNTPGAPAAGPGLSPKAINNMVFTSFRYYLP